ncbi:MAG: ribonuclease HII [Flavobacteriales bacterium]|jgi:ribonuclease HII|nr:ribonuclease HII [Flavobacteriales bacterium]MBT5751070.1 ribonuclease HII [Flavobacteriales bacterium]
MLKHFPSVKIIAGCDEAGRGCLAGPVVAAAVILPKGFKNKILKDSKVLSENKRDLLRSIIEKQAITWAIGIVSPIEIDKINILNASFLAMHRAIKNLVVKAELLIIDGNRFNPYPGIPHECIIKGDGKFMSIAAASILAKTYRDDIMKELDLEFPDYHWKNNKGYPTKQHRKAIAEIGANKQHRKTFQLLSAQLTLSL